MDRAELVELLTPSGLALLDSVAAGTPAELVSTVTKLRAEGHPAALVSAVLGQARLRARASRKFGVFADRMLFTQAGLEQATRLRVAALHAGRFSSAGLSRVVDLGSGIGGDALALASLDIAVTAVEIDEVTAAIASYNLAPFPTSTVIHADARDIDVEPFDAVFADPARRSAGHSETERLTDPDDYTPPLDLLWEVAERKPVGVKLGPGFDRSRIPAGVEAQWISVDGDVVELGLWTGVLARPGVTRAALVIVGDAAAEMTSDGDSEDEAVRPLGSYVYEPNGAVIRARLIGDLARRLGAGLLSERIAYLTSDEFVPSPFAQAFRVVADLPLDEKTIKKELRSRGIGVLEVKKRGADIDPAVFRRKMSLSGTRSATIILTRVAGRHRALLVDREPSD
ncbi:class I SAM-dependent methyltransferase [Labedella endophytica]|uniref:Class I SAM-dependent methyltransferase n=1 Tax=Labedella endophytica TaxID=1523160 RepID=A0A3S0VEH0_9MICO|nr:class I SAM-dependent methyltransferase [Labedella endophytica]RUQ98931.1 class I SAM-dependent methyltransferase [Labedella endophytica]